MIAALRAWLEDPAFKVCAFAVGSLYVLGKADRERLRIRPIPAVRPNYARQLLPDIPEAAVNSLWWLSRGKPRHLMKAAQRYRTVLTSLAHAIISFREHIRRPGEVSSMSCVRRARTLFSTHGVGSGRARKRLETLEILWLRRIQ